MSRVTKASMMCAALLLGASVASAQERAPNWTYGGAQDYAFLGWSVAGAGDVDGDGYADVIVGAPRYDDPEGQEGAAFLFRGGPSGLASTPSWTAERNQEDAEVGYTVSGAGDVNGDGYDDVIVGAHYYETGEAAEGAAFVYLGSATGLATTPAWEFDGDQAYAEAGIAVAAAGDVDHDGYDDILVGSNQYDGSLGDLSNQGRAWMFRGGPSGPSVAPDWTAEIDNVGAEFGYTLTGVGDVDQDGFDDVVIGAHYYGDQSQGAAYLYKGSATGLAATPAWSAISSEPMSQFSYAIAPAGDVNHDGYPDLIVGSHYSGDSGRAFLYLGSASGFPATPSWSAHGTVSGEEFGYSVAGVGDMDGDGYDDVVIGAQRYSADGSDPSVSQEGRIYFYRGTPDGLANSPSWTAEGHGVDIYLGWAVAAAGDVDGDGKPDFVVGAPGYTSSAFSVEGLAEVYLGSGTSNGGDPNGPGKSGCSCAISNGSNASSPALLLGTSLLGLAFLRRRRDSLRV